MDYLNAECYLRKLESKPGNRHMDLFLDNFKGRNFIKDAYRKKAWAQLLDGNDRAYQAEMAKVLEYGNDDVDIDKEAAREAQSGSLPHADLIRARLLFDGGYYLKADSVLLGIDTNELTEEMALERTYRAGRVAHKSGNMDRSKAYYLKTIEQGRESERYYAGNASLKMGEIYESEINPDSALYYYNLCLDLDFDEYEASIHAKAKAAVERLSE
jgi:hypothetical protein